MFLRNFPPKSYPWDVFSAPNCYYCWLSLRRLRSVSRTTLEGRGNPSFVSHHVSGGARSCSSSKAAVLTSGDDDDGEADNGTSSLVDDVAAMLVPVTMRRRRSWMRQCFWSVSLRENIFGHSLCVHRKHTHTCNCDELVVVVVARWHYQKFVWTINFDASLTLALCQTNTHTHT